MQARVAACVVFLYRSGSVNLCSNKGGVHFSVV